MREWFKARNVWGAAILGLSDEEAGRLAKAIWAYTMNGEVMDIEGAGKGIFAMILMTLAQDEVHDAEVSEKRSNAAKSKQLSANASNCIQMQSNADNCEQLIANGDIKNKNKNKSKNKNKEQESETDNVVQLKRFVPPTVDEVALYCIERHNHVNAEKFVDYYSSNGWKVGKNPMKDWRAAVRTWERSDLTEKDYQHDREFSGLPY